MSALLPALPTPFTCWTFNQGNLHLDGRRVGNSNPIEQHSRPVECFSQPVGCFDPHPWENLKVPKLRLMVVNVKGTRCLVLRVNLRCKVLLSSNSRELKIWESNICKTYFLVEFPRLMIVIMEIQSKHCTRNGCPCFWTCLDWIEWPLSKPFWTKCKSVGEYCKVNNGEPRSNHYDITWHPIVPVC